MVIKLTDSVLNTQTHRSQQAVNRSRMVKKSLVRSSSLSEIGHDSGEAASGVTFNATNVACYRYRFSVRLYAPDCVALDAPGLKQMNPLSCSQFFGIASRFSQDCNYLARVILCSHIGH